jgi:uncharacterized protein YabN with tetrapyrrole methylase and pyrophosphatase domain
MNPHHMARLFRAKIPRTTSPLAAAYRVSRRASQLGFDWPDVDGVFRKMDEESGELREAVAGKDQGKIAEEIGDLFFVLVNLARFLDVDPDRALKSTLKKFVSRFHFIEESLREKGRSFHESDLAEMDRLWEEAKKSEKK